MKATRIPLLLGEAALLVGLLSWYFLQGSDLPSASWQVGEDRERSEIFQEVAAETPIRLALDLPFEAYVYLVSHDLVYGCSALFPSEYLRSDIPANPLAAGEHLFPGTAGDIELSWQSGDATSPYSCMLIVSETEIPGLATALGRLRQMGNAAFPKKNLLGGYAPKAGMDQTPAANDLLHDAIKAAYQLDDPNNDGPLLPWEEHPGIYLKVCRLKNSGRNLQQGSDLRSHLNESLSKEFEGLIELPKPGK